MSFGIDDHESTLVKESIVARCFAMPHQPKLPPPDAIRRAAGEVVARPYYDLGLGVGDNSEPFLIEILRWILKPFRWMFDSMEGLPEVVRWLVVILCVVLCAALISHIVYTLVMAIRGPVLRRRQEFASTVREVDASDLERQAELSGGRGDYIGAVRLLFRAALRRIELSEQRKFRPGITNRELFAATARRRSQTRWRDLSKRSNSNGMEIIPASKPTSRLV